MKEPRYTLTFRNLSFNDVCSLQMETDPHRDGPRGWCHQRVLKAITREFRRCMKTHNAWRAANLKVVDPSRKRSGTIGRNRG